MDEIKNFAVGEVSLGYDESATSIVLVTGFAVRFPTAPFNVVWWDHTTYPAVWDDPNVEIVRVTAVVGETLTITRAQEGTSASTKNTAGKTYCVMQALTKDFIDEITTDLAAKANSASPTFTGVPAAPTATAGTSTTQIATTAFVDNAVGATGALTPFGTISVKDDPYNAVGDGVTDDTDAIQAAIDAAFGPPSAPHGQTDSELNSELYFPPGDYIITRPLLLTKVHGSVIKGAGRFTSKIRNTAGGSVIITNGWQYSVMKQLMLETTAAAGAVTNVVNRFFGQPGVWGVLNATVTQAIAASPLDGLQDAVLITDATGSNIIPQVFYDQIRVHADNAVPETALGGVTNDFTFSVYMKKNAGDFAYIAFGGPTNWVSAVFNLNLGTVPETDVSGSGTISTTSIDAVSGEPGWYRCRLSANLPDSNYAAMVGTAPLGTGNTFADYGVPEYNGTSALSVIVGKEAQIESGLTLSDYAYQPCCLDIDNDGLGIASLQSNSINDMFFDGGNYGVRIGVSRFQGSEMVFNNCFWIRAQVAGLKTCNFNALQMQIFGGNFQSNFRSIWCATGSVPVIHGVGFQQSSDWDIIITASAQDSYSILGCRSESLNFLNVYSFPTVHVVACSHTGLGPGTFIEAHGPVTCTASQSTYGIITGNSLVRLESCSIGPSDLWQNTSLLPFPSHLAISTGTPFTLTAAQIATGQDRVINLTAALGGDGTVTTPTAAEILAVLAQWSTVHDGWSCRLRIINSSSGAFTWTLAAGANVTLAGTMTIAQSAWRDFILTVGGSLTTVTIQSIGVGGASAGGDPTLGGDLTGTASAAAIAAGAIVNADVNASAAIDQSKIASLTSDLALKAPLASPTFTGVPAAPTAAAATNTTQLATTEFVTTADNLKANLASPTFTGTPAAPTAAAATSTTQLATTAFVQQENAAKAPLASPTFTGNPLAPTPSANDNDTSIATTAYVQSELTAYASDSVAFTNKTVNGLTVTTSTGTLTVANGKTLTASNSITLAGTDATTMTFPPASASVGYLEIPQNSQSAAYTLVLADSGKHILHPAADTTARIFTIPANGSVAFPVGTAVTFINQNAGGVITISITTDTMRLAGSGSTTSRTLAANGIATAVKITTTEWIISGTGLT